MLFCIALLNGESVHTIDSDGDGLDDLSFHFEPDSGIRLSCAALPRVSWAEGGNVVLYHGSHLTSGGGQFRSVSSDGLSYSASEETPEEVGTPIYPDELPPILKDRDGFALLAGVANRAPVAAPLVEALRTGAIVQAQYPIPDSSGGCRC